MPSVAEHVERAPNAVTSSRPAPPSEPAVNDSRLAWLLVVAGAIGFVAACTLLIEKIALIEDPAYVPTCSINPILSCGSVMRTPQAEAFGFPNPILGVVGFTVVMTTGFAVLAGGTFRRWYWTGLQVGATFGVVFVHWLIFQSLYRIGALCPYCMVVWVVTILIFVYTTRRNLSTARRVAPALRSVSEYQPVILTGWYLAIATLVAVRFWDYWSSLLT